VNWMRRRSSHKPAGRAGCPDLSTYVCCVAGRKQPHDAGDEEAPEVAPPQRCADTHCLRGVNGDARARLNICSGVKIACKPRIVLVEVQAWPGGLPRKQGSSSPSTSTLMCTCA
jgi:hypothetical protein